MLRNTEQHNPEGNKYAAMNDANHFVSERGLVASSNDFVLKQKKKGRERYERRHEIKEMTFLLRKNSDEFDYVLSPETLPTAEEFTIDTHQLVPIILVGMAMILGTTIIAVIHLKRKTRSQKSRIFRDIQTFDVDDINVKRAPTGGYNGKYSVNGITDLKSLLKNDDVLSSTNTTTREEDDDDEDDDDDDDEAFLAASLASVQFSDYEDEYYLKGLELSERKGSYSVHSGDII